MLTNAEASHYRAESSHYRAEASHYRAEAFHYRPLDDAIAYSNYLDWLSLKNKGVHWLPRFQGDTLVGYVYVYCCPGIKRYTPPIASLLRLNSKSFCLPSKIGFKMVPKILLKSSKKPMLTIDELEKVERKRVANLVGHVFQLTNRKNYKNFYIFPVPYSVYLTE